MTTPLDSFDYEKCLRKLSEEEQKKCFHYSNLQPLWASNIIPPSKDGGFYP